MEGELVDGFVVFGFVAERWNMQAMKEYAQKVTRNITPGDKPQFWYYAYVCPHLHSI